jgi:acyl-CoA synthetase (AMP-forming)/AMP-acid ligase II
MISQRFRQVAERHGPRLAIVDGSERITYAELSVRVDAARVWLRRALDPQPGAVVALSLENSWQFVACFFAASELGCTLIACNPQLRAAELRALAGRLRFHGAVIDPRFSAEWHPVCDMTPTTLLSVGDIPAQGDAANSPAIELVNEDSTVLFLSTSGSTGRPRLVPRSHRNLAANTENVAGSLDIGPGRRFLSVVPFHFSNGFNNSMMLPLLNGATLVLMRQFSPGACAELVHRERIDMLFGSPFIYACLVDREPELLSSLQWCFTAGGRIPSGVVERCFSRLGIHVRQFYGMTETGVIALERATPPSPSSAGACVGEPVPGAEVIVLGADGDALEPGGTGELAVRSASLMSGYFGEPELSRSRFHNGFFRTGDLGCFDSAGRIHLAGRMGRGMNISGVKVDPVEVERAIEMLPKVASCHVDAVPNGRGGEVIRARVVPREGLSVTRREVIEQCRQQLAEYKLPRMIEFLETSPASLAGKIPQQRPPEPGPQAESGGSS